MDEDDHPVDLVPSVRMWAVEQAAQLTDVNALGVGELLYRAQRLTAFALTGETKHQPEEAGDGA